MRTRLEFETRHDGAIPGRGGVPLFSWIGAEMDDLPPGQGQDEFDADVVSLDGGSIETVEAETVRISQGGVERVIASEVGLERGGAGVINAETVGLQLSGALTVRGDNVTIKDSGAGIVVADKVTGSNAYLGVTVTNSAELNGGHSVVLLAREVHGNVETILDTRGAMVAGLVAGVAVGVVLLIGGLLIRRR